MGEKRFLYGMITSMLCWGISWPIGKVLSMYGDAGPLAFLRFGVTFGSLLVILIMLREKLVLPKTVLPKLLAASGVMTLYGYLFLKGLSYGKAGAGGVLVTTLNPILTYALTMVITFRRPSKKETIGLLIGLCAGFILLRIWENSETVFDLGNVYFVMATALWAVLSKVTASSSKYGSPVVFSLWMYACCTLVMCCFIDYSNTLSVVLNGDWIFWLSLFYSATITTTLATTFYFYATTKIGADKASSFIFLVPLSASLGSLLLLNEIPVWNTVVGGILGIVAVYILNSKIGLKKEGL